MQIANFDLKLQAKHIHSSIVLKDEKSLGLYLISLLIMFWELPICLKT